MAFEGKCAQSVCDRLSFPVGRGLLDLFISLPVCPPFPTSHSFYFSSHSLSLSFSSHSPSCLSFIPSVDLLQSFVALPIPIVNIHYIDPGSLHPLHSFLHLHTLPPIVIPLFGALG